MRLLPSMSRLANHHWHRFCLVLVALVAFPGRADQSTQPLEYPVKAAFLNAFANYVAWPAEAFPEPNSPLVVGVLGEDPFGPALEANLQGKTAQHRPLQIQRFARLADIKPCHILFISTSERKALPEILTALRGRSILTVSEVPEFLEQGGMINFVFDRPNVVFEVNLMASKPERLELDARMLNVARLVILPSGERRTKNK